MSDIELTELILGRKLEFESIPESMGYTKTKNLMYDDHLQRSMCPTYSPKIGWRCTRPKGHIGLHEMKATAETAYARW